MQLSPEKRNYLIVALFLLFIGGSLLFQFVPGIRMGKNFALFARDMLLILPPAFVLIGLFDVWAKRETVERHLGETAGIRGYFWSVMLAATTVGGTFVAFPVANALYHKGARLSMVMAYVSAASLVMVPMSIMEASILGIRFTVVRLLVSIPLVIMSSMLIERLLNGANYRLPVTEKP